MPDRKAANEARVRLAMAMMRREADPGIAYSMIAPQFSPDAPLRQPNQRVSSPFGERIHPILKKKKFHTGVDLPAPEGTPVYATEDGWIANNQPSTIGGNQVFMRHPGSGQETRYEHMRKLSDKARRGGLVRKGEVLGWVGSTGRSTGPHLHYGQYAKGKAVNPQYAAYQPRAIQHARLWRRLDDEDVFT